jgi:hypothetical protein
MTKDATTKPKSNGNTGNNIMLTHTKDDDPGEVLANAMLGQNIRHGAVASNFAGRLLSKTSETLALMDCAKVIGERASEAIGGDLSFASAMLASQAVTLDTMFTDLAGRASLNMGEYIDAADRYARLAFKAQSNCRATLETLAKLHQPREQTVRHIHVNEGGQAVIADQFHNHTGGKENAKSAEQPHATAANAVVNGPAMLGQNPFGNGVPIPGGQGCEAMPDARRTVTRGT